MRLRQPRLALVVALAALAVGNASGAGGPAAPDGLIEHRPGADAEFVPGEVVVRFRSGVPRAHRAQALDAADARVEQELRLPRLVLARTDLPVPDAVRELERLPAVLYAEPNYIYRAAATIPNDPRFGELWGLHQASDKDIDAPEAWDLTTGSPNVTIAVVDTGIAYAHPDLAPNTWINAGESGGGRETNGLDDDGNGFADDWRGWDFVLDDNDPVDENVHGTHVAGTAGARGQDATGVAGVSWHAKLMPVRVLDPDGSGSNSDIAAGFTYACELGADIVNASLGGNAFSNAMRDAILNCPNTLFVVAAGNESVNLDTNARYPCLYHLPANGNAQNLLCVAATTSSDGLASFSNFSATGAHLGAPGNAVLSAIPAQQTIATDSFEDDASLPGTWTTSGTSLWSRTSERSVSPSFSAADSPGGNYLPNTTSRLQRAPVSLVGQHGCDAVYNLRLATEGGADRLWLEHATSAAGPWTAVVALSGSTGGAFFPLSFPLTGVEGAAEAHVSFRLTSNAANQFDGAHLDDVAIKCLTNAFGPGDYALLDGTSMATPHVAGVAALLLARDPTLSLAALRTAVLGGVETIPSLAGKTVTGGRLNALKALEVVGPPGAPTGVTATAGDGRATVSWSPPAATGGSAITSYVITPFVGPVAQAPVEVADVTSHDVTGLENGTSYTFRVAAENDQGVGAVSAPSVAVTPVAAAPSTIVTGPSGTHVRSSAVFTLASDVGGAGFECRVNGGGWTACSSPHTLSPLYPGRWMLEFRAVNAGTPDPSPEVRELRVVRPLVVDWDDDGKANVNAWRPGSGGWLVQGMPSAFFGRNGDVPVPGQWDADAAVDRALWRPASGGWYVEGSPTQYLGAAGDVPVAAQWDADPELDRAVWRPGSGGWYVQGSATSYFGRSGDVPVPGDYDADAALDRAVFRPSNGGWYVEGSAPVFHGQNGDIPIPADWNADGKTDIAVFRPSNSTWYLRGISMTTFGAVGDVAMAGDFDADAAVDKVLFRPSTGAWYVDTAAPFAFFGVSTDIP